MQAPPVSRGQYDQKGDREVLYSYRPPDSRLPLKEEII